MSAIIESNVQGRRDESWKPFKSSTPVTNLFLDGMERETLAM